MTGAFGVLRPSREGRCPCGGVPAGASYEECCGPFHAGTPAPTAERLMRSRYAAFALGDEGYLLRTWHPRTRPEDLRLDPRHGWLGLEVLASQAGGADDAVGEVTYRARSRSVDGCEHVLEERSRFERRAARWVYVDGDIRG